MHNDVKPRKIRRIPALFFFHYPTEVDQHFEYPELGVRYCHYHWHLSRLQELGLKEGEELHFNVTATIAVFVQQLVDLLEAGQGDADNFGRPGITCGAT